MTNQSSEPKGSPAILHETTKSGATFLQVASTGEWSGRFESPFDVSDGACYLSVTLTERMPDIDSANVSLQKPDGVDVSVISPDGSKLQALQAAEQAGYFLMLQELPMAGKWSLAIESPAGKSFHCEARVMPLAFLATTNEEEFLDFASRLARTRGAGNLLHPDSRSMDQCVGCKIGIGAALLAIGIVVILIAFALGAISKYWPPLLIIAAAVAKLGIEISAHALAGLLVDIVSQGNNTVDTIQLRFCQSFKLCPA